MARSKSVASDQGSHCPFTLPPPPIISRTPWLHGHGWIGDFSTACQNWRPTLLAASSMPFPNAGDAIQSAK